MCAVIESQDKIENNDIRQRVSLTDNLSFQELNNRQKESQLHIIQASTHDSYIRYTDTNIISIHSREDNKP